MVRVQVHNAGRYAQAGYIDDGPALACGDTPKSCDATLDDTYDTADLGRPRSIKMKPSLVTTP